MQKSFVKLMMFSLVLISCGTVPPEKYFSTAALNCNLLYGFAGSGMQRQLASPSEKLIDQKTYATAPMKRAEVVKEKLEQLETNYKAVKGLDMNEDAREMIEASIALYAFALPVYKNEYTELALLYDNGATAEKITAIEKSISDKYEAKFETLYNAVITTGTAFAARNNIKVQTVNPEP